MNNQRRGFVVPLVITIIAILLVVGGSYVYYQHTPTLTATPIVQNIPVVTATTPPAQPPALTAYTSNLYGFSIGFPLTVQTGKQFDWGEDTSSNIGVFLMAIPLQDGKNGYGTGQINIGFSTSTLNIATCLNLPPNDERTFQQDPNVTVNGINFIHFTNYQPALGQFRQTDSYRTIHNGACWALDFNVDGLETNRLSTSDAALANADYAQLQAEFNASFQTFTFFTITN